MDSMKVVSLSQSIGGNVLQEVKGFIFVFSSAVPFSRLVQFFCFRIYMGSLMLIHTGVQQRLVVIKLFYSHVSPLEVSHQVYKW